MNNGNGASVNETYDTSLLKTSVIMSSLKNGSEPENALHNELGLGNALLNGHLDALWVHLTRGSRASATEKRHLCKQVV